MNDHVRVLPGPAEEVAVVRWIFEQFLAKKYQTVIALELNQRGVPSSTGGPWNASAIGRILRNESYIGNLVYNRASVKLRERRKLNPPNLWIRSEGCIEPIIERDVFLRAQKIINERRVDLSAEEMLKRLRLTLKRRGKLTPDIITQTAGLPSVHTFRYQFGSLREAYRLIGYTSSRDCEFIESRKGWADFNAKLAAEVAAEIEKAGAHAEIIQGNSTSCERRERLFPFELLVGFRAGKKTMPSTGRLPAFPRLLAGSWRLGWANETERCSIICCCLRRALRHEQSGFRRRAGENTE